MQEAAPGRRDSDAPRRAELLAEISNAQEARRSAPRFADGTIDREDWLDIRHRTEDQITVARREYDRLTGSAKVLTFPHPTWCGTRGRGGIPTAGAPRLRRYCKGHCQTAAAVTA